ncbi:hypothetical protein POSPLADRAFT_1037469 [Postia placenta MAD-698-R-SB12]|uniref:Uncharacterized protein n=1 Tax=Postia placenta MAD-698-R-SB12 TaxID=670580 RepID=A0A1X6MJC0_9APHY|nr:hypothetical protein POSPLADRAFT_1037469 [Postia placenta MAD-698-R-SB12]OSX56474.1 hypothetical protein POSPLADRAFT_1037469 [Postia placenta MAD-698-R-SB12]
MPVKLLKQAQCPFRVSCSTKNTPDIGLWALPFNYIPIDDSQQTGAFRKEMNAKIWNKIREEGDLHKERWMSGKWNKLREEHPVQGLNQNWPSELEHNLNSTFSATAHINVWERGAVHQYYSMINRQMALSDSLFEMIGHRTVCQMIMNPLLTRKMQKSDL